MFGKRRIAALVAEFLGTGVLTLLILSVQRTQLGLPLFVGLAAGLALMVMTFAVIRVSGAQLNPAITFGMWTARKTTTLTAIFYIVVQFLGAYAAYKLYAYYTANNPAVAQSLKHAVGGHFVGRMFVAEAVGTGIFAFAWASAVYQRFTTAVSASVAGIAYTVGIIAAGSVSAGLSLDMINPAVAVGTNSIALTYLLGPVIGAIVGINLYKYLFAETETLAVVTASTSPVVTPTSTRTSVVTKKPVVKKKTTRAKNKK